MTAPSDDPLSVIASLNEQGIFGLDHLRLWGHFNDLLREGLDRNVGAPFAIYLSATAHGYLALVALRKLLDQHPRAAGIDYLLRVVEGAHDDLVRRMEDRDPVLRIDPCELCRRLVDHRKLLAGLRERAQPALKMVNQLVVHIDRAHVGDPDRRREFVEKARVSRETLAGYFRAAQWIVNGWKYVWDCSESLWEASTNRDDFAGIRAALVAVRPPQP